MKPDALRRALIMGGSAAILAGCTVVPRLRGDVAFAVVNTRLVIRGDVDARAANDFKQVLAENPQITTVVLQQMRGAADLRSVIEMGYEIRARGLGTYLQSDSDLFGDAVYLFLAGVQRGMYEGAQIGLRPQAGQADPARDSAANTLRRAYVVDMLGSGEFYGFALQATAANGIHILNMREIAQYGLLTGPVERTE